MKKGCFIFLQVSVIFALVIMGIAVYPAFSQNQGKSATIQLLPDRGLAGLRDEFREVGTYAGATVKARLTIINHSNQTLKVDMNGKNGNFHFEVAPNIDNSYFVNPGSYMFELSTPGFPSAAGKMSLSDRIEYVWEIWKDKL